MRYYIYIIVLLAGIQPGKGAAQRIQFNLYSGSGIDLNTGTVDELNFNDKQTVITSGDMVQILLLDPATAILTITGRSDLDVSVTIDAPPTLDLDAGNKIPLQLRYAYSNLGAVDENQAKTQAVEIPQGFSRITFPLRRRVAGPPGPPPTPEHAGYSGPQATAYLFIYGNLGIIPSNAAAGLYTGDISVSVTYEEYTP